MLYNNGTNDTIAFGKTLHLRCQTNSVPITKSFSFYQNGMLLNKTSTGVLDIPNVQRSHAGLITCHPRNLIGVGETAHVNLTVVYEGISFLFQDFRKLQSSILKKKSLYVYLIK